MLLARDADAADAVLRAQIEEAGRDVADGRDPGVGMLLGRAVGKTFDQPVGCARARDDRALVRVDEEPLRPLGSDVEPEEQVPAHVRAEARGVIPARRAGAPS